MKIKLHHFYILSTSIAMLMYFGLKRTSMPWWYSSLHCFIWIAIGLLCLNRIGIRKKLNDSEKSIVFLFGTPFIFYWTSTVVAWAINSYIEPNTISRSISITIQYMLILFYVLVVARLFKDKLIKYTFQAAVLNNIIVILFAIARWGIKDFVTVGLFPTSEYASSWTLDNLNVSAYLEVHDITFAFGFFLIYFFLFYEGKDRVKNIIICSIFIYLGLKRIQLAALFLVIGLSILIKGKSKRGIRYWSVFVTIASLTVLLFYIWLIDSNLIAQIANSYNINFRGRLRVYYNLGKYFTFGPGYFGHGMSYGRIVASNLVEQKVLNFTGHSDVLMNYIDYGFWEFIIWIVFMCFTCTKYINKMYGSSPSRMWLLFVVYALITYLTDNTSMYFCFQSIFMIIMYNMFVKKSKEDIKNDGEHKYKYEHWYCDNL